MFSAVVTLLLLVYSAAQAAILRVPTQYPTIQAALDAAAESDTVVIASGVYEEALLAPPFSFRMVGEVLPDTTVLSGAIVDIGPLPGADSLGCLTLSSGVAAIESLMFRNSLGAHSETRVGAGGIRAGQVDLTLRHVVFDSVQGCVDEGGRIFIENCTFLRLFGAGVFAGQATVVARNSLFSGDGYAQLAGGSGTTIVNCVFERNRQGHMVILSGDSIFIDSSVFRDFGPYPFVPVELLAGEHSVISNSRFSGIRIGPQVLRANVRCDSGGSHDLELRNLTFEDYEGGTGQGGFALLTRCGDMSPYVSGYPVAISNCSFTGGVVHDAWLPVALENEIPVHLDSTSFSDLEPENQAVIRQNAAPSADTSVYRACSFDSFAYAVEAGSPVDARWNWWGDSTGPYNSFLNPEGLGAEVSDGVLFEPWLRAPPDSSDTNEIAVDLPSIAIPESYQVSAYPNPFNASVMLQVEVVTPGVYALRLYDVTGREVAQIFGGMIRGRTELRYANSELASGVYFAQLSNPGGTLATAKVLLLK